MFGISKLSIVFGFILGSVIGIPATLVLLGIPVNGFVSTSSTIGDVLLTIMFYMATLLYTKRLSRGPVVLIIYCLYILTSIEHIINLYNAGNIVLSIILAIAMALSPIYMFIIYVEGRDE